MFQRNEYTIACILLIVIVCLATEVLRNQYVSTVILIGVGVLSYFIPETTTALPACVYGLLSDKKMGSFSGNFMWRKQRRIPTGLLHRKKHFG